MLDSSKDNLKLDAMKRIVGVGWHLFWYKVLELVLVILSFIFSALIRVTYREIEHVPGQDDPIPHLTVLVSFRKCSFNSIAHYIYICSLTNKTHSHQCLKQKSEITHFEVTFQWARSYLLAWYTPCEFGKSKSNCSSLCHVKLLDESKSFKNSWNSVSGSAIVLIFKHSKSTWRQLIILWKLQNHNIECSGHNAHSASRWHSGMVDLRCSHARQLIMKVSIPEWHICMS